MTACKIFSKPIFPDFGRHLLPLTVSALVSLSVPGMATAHDLWLQPGRFNLSVNGDTNVMLMVGHGKDRQKSLMSAERVVRFQSFSRAGLMDRRGDLRMGDTNADTRLRFQTPGLHLLIFETDGAYSELPALRFNDYLKAEGMIPALTLRAKTGKSGQPGREIYSRRAKSLIQVGPYATTDDATALRVVGTSLEIVPERNPYAPDFKGDLPVRIYYYGKPLAGATVMINNLDFDARPVETFVSDANGRVRFTVPRTGLWQLNVVWTRLINNNPKADFETTFSSLTFGYAPGSR